MDLIEQFVTDNGLSYAKTTIDTYRRSLVAFSTWLQGSGTSLDQLTKFDVQTFINQEARAKNPKTVIKTAAAIRTFCEWSNQQDAIQKLRVPSLADDVTAPKALTRKEELAALRGAERAPVRSKAIFHLLFYTGLRVSELCGLNVSSIKLEKFKNGLRGELKVHGKGNRFRTVLVPHTAAESIQEWLSVRPDADDKSLFLSNFRTRMSARMVERICRQIHPDVHPHRLRHTYITKLVRSGMDLVTVAALAGHKSIATLQIYSKPTQEEMDDAVFRVFDEN